MVSWLPGLCKSPPTSLIVLRAFFSASQFLLPLKMFMLSHSVSRGPPPFICSRRVTLLSLMTSTSTEITLTFMLRSLS